MALMVWRVTPTWAASFAWDHSRSARSTRSRVLNRGIRSLDRLVRKFLGPTWGQNQGLLGPNLGFSGGKGNRLNRTFGRGGGDRTTRVVEDAQVVDSTKRPKGEKPQKR